MDEEEGVDTGGAKDADNADDAKDAEDTEDAEDMEDVADAAMSGGKDTELLRRSSSEDGEGRGQKAGRLPSWDEVLLSHTNRLTSFFRYRGFSSSSRGCAGAAAAKHNTGSNVERTTKDAAMITDDLRNIFANCGNVKPKFVYYLIDVDMNFGANS